MTVKTAITPWTAPALATPLSKQHRIITSVICVSPVVWLAQQSFFLCLFLSNDGQTFHSLLLKAADMPQA
jgi:hypothetical protein